MTNNLTDRVTGVFLLLFAIWYGYRTTLFKRERIEKLIGYYLEIIKQVLENNEIKLGDIELAHDYLVARSALQIEEEEDFGF